MGWRTCVRVRSEGRRSSEGVLYFRLDKGILHVEVESNVAPVGPESAVGADSVFICKWTSVQPDFRLISD